jgi:hypothetical protein
VVAQLLERGDGGEHTGSLASSEDAADFLAVKKVLVYGGLKMCYIRKRL